MKAADIRMAKRVRDRILELALQLGPKTKSFETINLSNEKVIQLQRSLIIA